MNMKKNRKGFTIVEMAIVIAVIAILATAMLPTFSGIIQKAKDSGLIQKAASAYSSYVANVDYTADSVAEKNAVIKIEDNKYVAVVDGELQNTVYSVGEGTNEYDDEDALFDYLAGELFGGAGAAYGTKIESIPDYAEVTITPVTPATTP